MDDFDVENVLQVGDTYIIQCNEHLCLLNCDNVAEMKTVACSANFTFAVNTSGEYIAIGQDCIINLYLLNGTFIGTFPFGSKLKLRKKTIQSLTMLNLVFAKSGDNCETLYVRMSNNHVWIASNISTELMMQAAHDLSKRNKILVQMVKKMTFCRIKAIKDSIKVMLPYMHQNTKFLLVLNDNGNLNQYCCVEDTYILVRISNLCS